MIAVHYKTEVQMQTIIMLEKRSDGWVAHFSDTNETIMTAFTERAEADYVKNEIQSRNMNCLVVIS